MVDAALESLAGLFKLRRAKLAELLDEAHTSDWLVDHFARGAYSYVKVGRTHARNELRRPIDDTLFFAGEATDTSGQASTVAGALASRQRRG